MVNHLVPRSYYFRSRSEAMQDDDESPPHPEAAIKDPGIPSQVIGISHVRDFDSMRISDQRGMHQTVEIKSSVLREISAADLLRVCDDAERAGVELQIKVMEDQEGS